MSKKLDTIIKDFTRTQNELDKYSKAQKFKAVKVLDETASFTLVIQDFVKYLNDFIEKILQKSIERSSVHFDNVKRADRIADNIKKLID